MKIKLTPRIVREMRFPPDMAGKKYILVYDTELSGFGVRLAAGGKKTYIVEIRKGSKSTRITIGNCETLSLAEAKERARATRYTADQGKDPRKITFEEDDNGESILIDPITGLEVWHTYIEERWKIGAWKPRTYKEHQAVVYPGDGTRQRGILYDLLTRPLHKIDRAAIEEWMLANTHRKSYARLSWRYLRAFLRWCSETDDYADLLADRHQPSRRAIEALGRPKAKQDAVQREHLAAWFDAVRNRLAATNPTAAAFVQFVLLTGCRPGEARALTWDDIDTRFKTITFADTKAGESRTIGLTPYVAQLLDSLPRTSTLVFATQAGKKLSQCHKQLQRVAEWAGIDYVSEHGLRRSFGTLAEWCDLPSGVTAQIMGHKPSAIAEKHYRVRPVGMLREFHERIEKFIIENAGLAGLLDNGQSNEENGNGNGQNKGQNNGNGRKHKKKEESLQD
ncbi:tyrosine-type recombinase/integrase [Tepidiphilus margaritifer]|uniref:tyrosine-type recombinase/integrase n=1 Tax=Tepidiphilus margaritifer TaxID=203471 RepID=UPI00040FBE9A|nr:site-specific integrase [Tepidiphilus margaritifer]